MLAGNANFQPVDNQQWARGVTFVGDLTGAFTLTATLGSGAGSSTGSGTSGLNFSNATIQSVSANIAGSSGLTKLGSGVTTLTGTNTYTGMTAISNGTLFVNGSLASGSAVIIASAGTLGGTGIVAGTVTVNGTIAPGTNGGGTLNTGTETWNGGGSCLCQINSTNAGGSVLLNITGTLNALATGGNNFTVKFVSLTAGNTAGRLASFNKFTNYSWPVATANGGILNFAANKFSVDAYAFANDFSGGAFTLSTNGNSLLVKYLAAPLVSPKFTAIASGGGLQLSGTGGMGQAYVLLAATNLVPANWMPIATNLANTNSIFQFTDQQTTNYGQRFYRLSNP
jgi:autotransporter-associated beta strand protein